MLLTCEESALVIIDVQEKLLPAIHDRDHLLTVIEALLEVASLLDVPVTATEHCPERIGGLLPRLRHKIDPSSILPKVHFNALAEPHSQSHFKTLGRKRPIVCGVEAHVCVLQTAFGLKKNGFDPVVVADAAGSRKPSDHLLALDRARDAGISVVSSEMVIFEWLERGDRDEFRQLLPIIKRLGTS